MNLKDKIIMVSGASSGIGLETAIRMKKKGTVILANGRNKDKLNKVCKENGFEFFPGDVSKESDVVEIFGKIKSKFGKLDALINNAGYGYFDKIENVDAKKFNEVLGTNVIGAALMAREASKIFIDQHSGAIVNIASTAAKKGFAGGTPYAASKFALRGMTECWQQELRQYNVRVILINPSEVQTDFKINSGRTAADFNPNKLISEDIAHAIISALEMEDRGFITELTVFATNPREI